MDGEEINIENLTNIVNLDDLKKNSKKNWAYTRKLCTYE